MPRPRKRKARKRKGKVCVNTQAQVRKKTQAPKDTIPSAPTRLAGDNAANFKIKVRVRPK